MTLLSELVFGSYYSYTPRPISDEQKLSKSMMYSLKQNSSISSVSFAHHFTQKFSAVLSDLPMKHFFSADTVLVPVPASSFMQTGQLWVAKKVSEALANKGLGVVSPCLERVRTIPKSSYTQAANRPKAHDHYETLRVNPGLSTPWKIVLVDDVVTRGATMLACASKIKESFPDSIIYGFAVMRTISEPEHFTSIEDPCCGTIVLQGLDAYRTP